MEVKKMIVKVKGMDCASCVRALETYFSKLEGIKATVSLATEEVMFDITSEHWTRPLVEQNIRSAGYKPMIELEKGKRTFKEKLEFAELISALALTLVLMASMLWHMEVFSMNEPSWLYWVNNPYVQLVIGAYILFFVGRRYYIGAYKSLKNKVLGMDVLVVMSTTIAFGYSVANLIINKSHIDAGHWMDMANKENRWFYFDIIGEVITFLLIGKIIEKKISRKANEQLRGLLELQVKEVSLPDGKIIPADDVKVGMQLAVRKGEKIPFDGIIVETDTLVNESALTGESKPIHKLVGESVLGGSLNVGHYFIMEVNKEPSQSMIARIIETVRKMQASKPPIQKLADKISNYFVPTVALISLVTFIVMLVTNDMNKAILVTLPVLIVACPCSLGLATPVSIASGTSRAAREGILYNKADVFERFKNINVACFDKTGTITTGDFKISETYGDISIMKEIVSLEIQSIHPISAAFMDWKHNNQFDELQIEDYKETIGSGVSGKVNGIDIIVGSEKFMPHVPGDDFQTKASQWASQGKVVIYVSQNGKVTTLFALEDQIKTGVQSAIVKLKSKGIEPVMITGDNELTAKYVAKQVGIDKVYARITPEQKADIIKEFKNERKRVLFAGDGVNDAVALNEANIAISMADGSDIAKTSSDITLVDGDLNSILFALKVANGTLRNIRQNLTWAFIWNGVMISAAIFGFIPAQIAAWAMVIESTIVTLNGTRINFYKFDKEEKVNKASKVM